MSTLHQRLCARLSYDVILGETLMESIERLSATTGLGVRAIERAYHFADTLRDWSDADKARLEEHLTNDEWGRDT